MIQMDTKSIAKLENVHPDLVALVNQVSEHLQVRVLCGYRDQEAQNSAFASGHSKKQWPHSKHNSSPSLAVDLCVEPYNPGDLQQLLYFAGFVMGVATSRGLRLRSGTDWDGIFCPAKNRFPDLFHFELLD